MPSRASKLSLNQKLTLSIAVLAIVATIIAALISSHDWFSPQLSTPQVTTSPTPSSGKISFASIENPNTLNTNLQWEAGSSNLSTYSLQGDEIVITAGPDTWPNFPMINYKPIINGDFSLSVKVSFVPDATILKTAQMAGMLVHPINTHLAQDDAEFPNDWLATSKYITDAGSLVGCRGAWMDYSSDTVFLKIARANNSWQCAYSSNGENWSYLDLSVNDAQLQNQQLAVSLFAYSNTDNAINVTFSDWEMDYGR